jgi:hypothetical protein
VSKLAVGNIPQYARSNSRFSWRVADFIELNMVGQNLLTPRPIEFPAPGYPLRPTLFEQSMFAKVTWRVSLGVLA